MGAVVSTVRVATARGEEGEGYVAAVEEKRKEGRVLVRRT